MFFFGANFLIRLFKGHCNAIKNGFKLGGTYNMEVVDDVFVFSLS
jgi:hypothetical protein